MRRARDKIPRRSRSFRSTSPLYRVHLVRQTFGWKTDSRSQISGAFDNVRRAVTALRASLGSQFPGNLGITDPRFGLECEGIRAHGAADFR